MPKLVADLFALVLTCGVAVVTVDHLAGETTVTEGPTVVATTLPPGPAPAPSQAFVSDQAGRFSTDGRTTLRAAGGVVVKLSLQKVELSGPGRLKAGGRLRVRSPSSVRDATSVES